ncbi:MAG: hypothetical protein NDI62_00015 [Burkholderiales bacterium]|nr:hypothetical protein [Burkholderiales bacterium]
MKKRILFVFVLILSLLSYTKVFAIETCSDVGYTILTINGIFTNEADARKNRDNLKNKLLIKTFNNEPLTVDFLYNPTHGKVVDLLAVVAQKYFDQNSFNYKDSDFGQMLYDTSDKLDTQKLLIVGHSQGNFYANSFYQNITDKKGGIPHESLGVYGVASPASYVAGDGKYLTSSLDQVINATRAGTLLNILPANALINAGENNNGHSFSDVYLKYQGNKIVADIKSSLNKLKNNEIQKEDLPCIDAPKLNLFQKVEGVAVISLDFLFDDAMPYMGNKYLALINGAGDIFANTGLALNNVFKNLSANVVDSLGDTSSLTTLSIDTSAQVAEAGLPQPVQEEIIPEINTNEEIIVGENIPLIQELIPAIPVEENKKEDAVLPSVLPNVFFGGSSSSGSAAVPEIPIEEIIEPVVVPIVEAPVVEPIVEPVIEPVVIPSIPEVVLISTIIDVDTTLVAGEYNYDNLIVKNNATLLLESNVDSVNLFKGVKINAKNITIENGSHISADAKGYQDGPGAPIVEESFAGASYGGAGDRNVGAPIYGSAKEPIELGSGGVNYYKGGGAIRLVVEDVLLNDGTISANGDVTSSGGSIFITTKNLKGNGFIKTNGGGLYSGAIIYGSGGGGRVALYYENSSFTGIAEAKGGCGSYNGYSAVCANNGTVGFFDTLNNNLLVDTSWNFQKNDSPFNFNQIIFNNGAKIISEKDTNITASSILIDKISEFVLAENQIINIPSITINDSSILNLSGKENIISNTISLTSNSNVLISKEQTLSLTIPNINIENGSSIIANAKGYLEGPGANIVDTIGASYGGKGLGNTLESIYGSETEPVDFGSGGYGNYRGGGAIRIIANESLFSNGIISANGDVTSSGGSVYITTKNLSGSGIISANGGGMYAGSIYYGPGGGGRVAIYYDLSSFSGQITANGSNSYIGSSADGTVKMIDTSIPIVVPPDPDPIPEPVVDSGPDIVLPVINSYTFNGFANDITINPVLNPVTLIFNASENVNWMSIKIEKENDASVYKNFQSGANCVDGTNICTKIWDGTLSRGGLLESQPGIYKIKVHIKDAALNEFYDYVLPYKINVSF